MKIRRRMDTIYCTFALQDHEVTKETGYYLLYSLHFRAMRIKRGLDTIYCTLCTLGP